MGNIDRARRLIDAIRATGADEFCVCAGSRNSPLLAVLGSDAGVRLYSFVDERSAAFFALGRSKLHGAPVAVVTTSGTAVAEMLPAAIEAYYSAIPLILVSADRPARFRGTGAPQSIEQVGLFGIYAETDQERWTRIRPLHINIEFDEPLIDEEVGARDAVMAQEPVILSAGTALRGGEAEMTPHAPSRHPEPPQPRGGRVGVRGGGPRRISEWQEHGGAGSSTPRNEGSNSDEPLHHIRQSLSTFSRPLVVLGALRHADHARVRRFVSSLDAPTYAEPLSGLRESDGLPLIVSGERMLRSGEFDGVIRKGGVPTLRFWRDLEEMQNLQVIHFSSLPFAGLTRGEVMPIETLPESVERCATGESFFERDREQAARFNEILDEEPASELAMIRAVSRTIPRNARVYLGNSLPIREWDLAATRESRGLELEANRGANGIDGQLSTFFGQCDPSRENVCVIGDLTAIYDLGAPWIVPQLDAPFRIVVVNNGGGRIFSRVSSLRTLDASLRDRLIESSHAIRFDQWAAMWGLGDRMTELRPDPEASQRVWQRYDELWV